MKRSVIITSYNEGHELRNTVQSVRASDPTAEIVVVDDASDDGSTAGMTGCRVLRNDQRLGVAPSRAIGVAASTGDTLLILDGHCRVEDDAIRRCAAVAIDYGAIVWPTIKTLSKCSKFEGHGGMLGLKDMVELVGKENLTGAKRAWFDNGWRNLPPYNLSCERLTRCGGLVCPGYTIPRHLYDRVGWINGLSNWGASEACVNVKAWFCEIDILHLCGGPVVRHRFREKDPKTNRKWNFTVRNWQIARNHATIARVCFSEQTWRDWWWDIFCDTPRGVPRRMLEELTADEEICRQHEEFQRVKKRPDSEFFRALVGIEEPNGQ